MAFKRTILISTGDDKNQLDRLESRFAEQLNNKTEIFETLRLGQVESLLISYMKACQVINDDDAFLIFSHQDAYPAFLDSEINHKIIESIPDSHAYAKPAYSNPTLWIDIAEKLLKKDDCGFLGVAGSRELSFEKAWWNHKCLSGSVIHKSTDGNIGINNYGPWGQVAVLDGLCLMCRASTIKKIMSFTPDRKRFHFYDMELCIRALAAELINWTIPLLLFHESSGATIEEERWQNDMISFNKSFKEFLPVQVKENTLEI